MERSEMKSGVRSDIKREKIVIYMTFSWRIEYKLKYSLLQQSQSC
jgi:hypothetical protein